MGSNSKTRKTSRSVIKERGTSGSVAGGTGREEKSPATSECLFTLNFKQELPSGTSVKQGDFSSIVLTSDTEIEVVVGASSIGKYSDSKAKLLISCIGKGFVYEGEVVGVNGLEAEIEVVGNG